MGGIARRIAGAVIVALAVVAVIFGIVGASATTKGWFKAKTSLSETKIGTLKSCTTVGGLKTCCSLDNCQIAGIKLYPNTVQIGGKVALACAVIGLALAVVAGVLGALTIIGLKGETLIASGACAAFVAFGFLSASWATFLGIVFHWADDKNFDRPKADYALILTAIGGGLSLLIVFVFAFQGTQRHK